eukprot:910082-Rhodomonas_salina.1
MGASTAFQRSVFSVVPWPSRPPIPAPCPAFPTPSLAPSLPRSVQPRTYAMLRPASHKQRVRSVHTAGSGWAGSYWDTLLGYADTLLAYAEAACLGVRGAGTIRYLSTASYASSVPHETLAL